MFVKSYNFWEKEFQMFKYFKYFSTERLTPFFLFMVTLLHWGQKKGIT